MFCFFLLVVSLLVLKIIVLNAIQTFKTAKTHKTTPDIKYVITDLIHIVFQQNKVYGRSFILYTYFNLLKQKLVGMIEKMCTEIYIFFLFLLETYCHLLCFIFEEIN